MGANFKMLLPSSNPVGMAPLTVSFCVRVCLFPWSEPHAEKRIGPGEQETSFYLEHGGPAFLLEHEKKMLFCYCQIRIMHVKTH